MQVAIDYIEQGNPTNKVLTCCGIPRSSFYYNPTGGKAGREPYAVILNKEGERVSEQEIVDKIKGLFAKPFVDYGSYKTYRYLNDRAGYTISKHKVYTLMKTHSLLRLQYQKSSKSSKKKWVTELVPSPNIPFTFFEFDIKYIWVSGQKKNVQVLTILDVYSRFNVGQYIAAKITKENVVALFKKVIDEFGIPDNFIVRNDNGSQFEAEMVRDYLQGIGVTQEFTKPATPQQNAHIEAYHSIMERAVCQRFEFINIAEAKNIMEEFRLFYNFERIHGGIDFSTPYEYLTMNKPLLKENYRNLCDNVNIQFLNYQNVS